eukprot:358413-Chlamydomonas_euryale.AAC.15
MGSSRLPMRLVSGKGQLSGSAFSGTAGQLAHSAPPAGASAPFATTSASPTSCACRIFFDLQVRRGMVGGRGRGGRTSQPSRISRGATKPAPPLAPQQKPSERLSFPYLMR